MEQPPREHEEAAPNSGVLLGLFLFGLWLVFGGAMALYHGTSFVFFPIQLDFLLLFGPYVQGSLAVLLGALLMAIPVVLAVKRHDV